MDERARTGDIVYSRPTNLALMQRPYAGRDRDIAAFLSFINDPQLRLLAIYGLRGIGKTTFLHHAEHALPGWRRIRVDLTEGVGYARFLYSLAEQLGLPCPLERTSSLGLEEGAQLAAEILRRFDAVEPSCLVVDDWQYVLTRAGGNNYRDGRFLDFLTAIVERPGETPNKVVVASRQRFYFPGKRSTERHLEPLDPSSVRVILDYLIRSQRLEAGPIETPTALIERLHGNPLAATLVALLLQSHSAQDIARDAKVRAEFQNRLIELVLGWMDLDENERRLLGYLSVFNVPIPLDVIERDFGESALTLLESFLDCFIVEGDGMGGLRMCPLVREYFEAGLAIRERVHFHSMAARVYELRLESGESTVTDKAEHIAHLAHSLQYLRVKEHLFYVDELRPAAKRLFRDGKYRDALRYFEALDLVHRELEVLYYMGLCYTFLGCGEDAADAITEAMALDGEAWWVLLGYGGTLVTVGSLEKAEPQLARALAICRTERGRSQVYESLGRLHERRRDWKAAEHSYLKAVETFGGSVSAIVRYARFLWKQRRQKTPVLELLASAEALDSSRQDIRRLREVVVSGESADGGESDTVSEPSPPGEEPEVFRGI